MTDTASEADIILPAKNMFEQPDIIGSYWNPYVQYRPGILQPEGEVLPETSIYARLAEKLDLTNASDYIKDNDEAVAYLRKKVSAYPSINWEDLRNGPILPPNHEEVAYQNLEFDTPSGKIELYSKTAKDRWGADELPGFTPLKEGEDEHKTKYRFYLMTPNTKNRIHSQFGNLRMIKSVEGTPMAELSLSDSKELGIKEGAMIRIFNDRGEIRLKAKPRPGIRRGCISVINGLWINEGGTPNFLSLGRETDMGHGTAFHDNLVNIEKL
jgi:anaerobic selenocysteine-containing dehydrogenase